MQLGRHSRLFQWSFGRSVRGANHKKAWATQAQAFLARLNPFCRGFVFLTSVVQSLQDPFSLPELGWKPREAETPVLDRETQSHASPLLLRMTQVEREAKSRARSSLRAKSDELDPAFYFGPQASSLGCSTKNARCWVTSYGSRLKAL